MYEVGEIGDVHWPEESGLYVFCRLRSGGLVGRRWDPPLYVGQSQNFATYLPTHRKWREAARRGSTHIHVMSVEQKEDRDRIERELIEAYQPPLNVLLK